MHQLLGCGYRERRRDAEVPDVDMSAEVGGNGDSVPLKLRDGVELGGGELQVRGVVLGDIPSTQHLKLTGRLVGERTVERGALADVVARVGVAQAEYYFDDTKLGGTEERPLPRSEWLWNMGWTARLRPFRLSSGSGDDDGERGAAKGGAGDAVEGAVCDKLAGSDCSGLMEAFHLLGGES